MHDHLEQLIADLDKGYAHLQDELARGDQDPEDIQRQITRNRVAWLRATFLKQRKDRKHDRAA